MARPWFSGDHGSRQSERQEAKKTAQHGAQADECVCRHDGQSPVVMEQGTAGAVITTALELRERPQQGLTGMKKPPGAVRRQAQSEPESRGWPGLLLPLGPLPVRVP